MSIELTLAWKITIGVGGAMLFLLFVARRRDIRAETLASNAALASLTPPPVAPSSPSASPSLSLGTLQEQPPPISRFKKSLRIFAKSFVHSMREDHSWLNLYRGPPQPGLTRTQRHALLFVLMSSALFGNAALVDVTFSNREERISAGILVAFLICLPFKAILFGLFNDSDPNKRMTITTVAAIEEQKVEQFAVQQQQHHQQSPPSHPSTPTSKHKERRNSISRRSVDLSEGTHRRRLSFQGHNNSIIQQHQLIEEDRSQWFPPEEEYEDEFLDICCHEYEIHEGALPPPILSSSSSPHGSHSKKKKAKRKPTKKLNNNKSGAQKRQERLNKWATKYGLISCSSDPLLNPSPILPTMPLSFLFSDQFKPEEQEEEIIEKKLKPSASSSSATGKWLHLSHPPPPSPNSKPLKTSPIIDSPSPLLSFSVVDNFYQKPPLSSSRPVSVASTPRGSASVASTPRASGSSAPTPRIYNSSLTFATQSMQQEKVFYSPKDGHRLWINPSIVLSSIYPASSFFSGISFLDSEMQYIRGRIQLFYSGKITPTVGWLSPVQVEQLSLTKDTKKPLVPPSSTSIFSSIPHKPVAQPQPQPQPPQQKEQKMEFSIKCTSLLNDKYDIQQETLDIDDNFDNMMNPPSAPHLLFPSSSASSSSTPAIGRSRASSIASDVSSHHTPPQHRSSLSLFFYDNSDDVDHNKEEGEELSIVHLAADLRPDFAEIETESESEAELEEVTAAAEEAKPKRKSLSRLPNSFYSIEDPHSSSSFSITAVKSSSPLQTALLRDKLNARRSRELHSASSSSHILVPVPYSPSSIASPSKQQHQQLSEEFWENWKPPKWIPPPPKPERSWFNKHFTSITIHSLAVANFMTTVASFLVQDPLWFQTGRKNSEKLDFKVFFGVMPSAVTVAVLLVHYNARFKLQQKVAETVERHVVSRIESISRITQGMIDDGSVDVKGLARIFENKEKLDEYQRAGSGTNEGIDLDDDIESHMNGVKGGRRTKVKEVDASHPVTESGGDDEEKGDAIRSPEEEEDGTLDEGSAKRRKSKRRKRLEVLSMVALLLPLGTLAKLFTEWDGSSHSFLSLLIYLIVPVAIFIVSKKAIWAIFPLGSLTPSEEQKEKEGEFLLPWWCHRLAWLLFFAFQGAVLAFTGRLASEFSSTDQYDDWLISTGACLGFDLFISHTMCTLLQSSILALKVRCAKKYEEWNVPKIYIHLGVA